MHELIAQEHELGCAVACVANMLEISYSEAYTLFNDIHSQVLYFGFACPQIVYALDKAGWDSDITFVRDDYNALKMIEQENTIIYLDKSDCCPMGHFLLRKSDRWIDTYINAPGFPMKAGYRDELHRFPIWAIFCYNKDVT